LPPSVTTPPPPAPVNALIDALSAQTFSGLLPHLDLVRLARGETLHETCGPVRYAYFPTTAVISAFVDTTGGASAEIALIGREGGLGLMNVLSGTRGNFRTVVDTPGEAYRVKLETLRDALRPDAAARNAFLRYLTARTVQIAVTAVCNAHHSVQQRLCRALLMRLDRCGAGPLYMTQGLMAEILGARRTSVTYVANELRQAGAIDYTRGRLSVVDAGLLERYGCGCEHAIRSQTASLTTAG
jgi:CRP-like cAMP-binding protein